MSEQELEFIPLEPEAPKKKGVEQGTVKSHALHALASLNDAVGALPGTLGIIQAAVETPFHYIADPSKGWKESFIHGMDNPWLRLSSQFYDETNKALGITDPVGTEQVARLASAFIPMPGGLASSAQRVGMGMAASTADDAARAMALPFAQTIPGTSTASKFGQVVAQGGVAVGADQTFRNVAGLPTMFDDGTPMVPMSGVDETPQVPFDNTPPVDFVPEEEVKDQGLSDANASLILGLGVLASSPAVRRAATEPGAVLGVLNRAVSTETTRRMGQIGREKYLDSKMIFENYMRNSGADESEIDDVMGRVRSDYMASAQAFASTGKLPGGRRLPEGTQTMAQWSAEFNALTPEEQQAFNQGAVSIAERQNRIRATFDDFLDPVKFAKMADERVKFMSASLAKTQKKLKTLSDGIAGKTPEAYPDEFILNDKTGRMEHIDQRDVNVAKKTIRTLNDRIQMWKESKTSHVLTGKSGKQYNLNDIMATAPNFTLEERAAFLEDVRVKQKPIGLLTSSTDKKNLSPLDGESDVLASEAILNNEINAFNSNPKFVDMARRYGKINEGLLRYAVDEGVLSEDLFKQWTNDHTLDGLTFYVPGRERSRKLMSTTVEIMDWLGWSTTEANAFRRGSLPGNFQREAVDVGTGIRVPMAPMEAMQQYAATIIEHVNHSKIRDQFLSRFDEEASTILASGTKDPEKMEGIVAKKIYVADSPTQRLTENNYVVTQGDMNRILGGNQIEAITRDIMWVQKDGKMHGYFVPDPALRRALELAPNTVEGFSRVMAGFKKVYQVGTTHNPFFSMIQAAYATSTNMALGPSRGVWNSPITSARGIWEIAASATAQEVGTHFERMLANNSALARVAPDAVKGIRDRLVKRAQDSWMMDFNSETGGVASAFRTFDEAPGMPNILDPWNAALKSGSLPMDTLRTAGRFIDIFNMAMQDGPMLGLQIKIAKKKMTEGMEKDAALRTASLEGKRIAGDYRTRGSEMGGAIAAVPYLNPQIHGLAALGRALIDNPGGTSAGIAATVMAPTVAEFMMIETMGTEEQKEQYWKMSDSERVSNFNIPHPSGKGLITLPIDPNLRFFHASMLETIDAIGDYSNGYRKYDLAHGMGQMDEGVKQGVRVALMTGLAPLVSMELPPVVNAVSSMTTGSRFNIGLDPNSSKFGLIERNLPTPMIGEFGAGMSSSSGADIPKELAGVVMAVGGFGGTLAIQMAEGFMLGREGEITLGERTDRALDVGGESLKRFARLPSTLFDADNAVLPATGEIEMRTREKQAGFDNLLKAAKTYSNTVPGMNGGMDSYVIDPKTNEIAMGNVIGMPRDPAVQDAYLVMLNHDKITMGYIDDAIVKTNKQIQAIRGATRIMQEPASRLTWLSDKEGQVWTEDLKRRATNELNGQINALKLWKIQEFTKIEKDLSRVYGRDVTLNDFSTMSLPQPAEESLLPSVAP